MLRRTVLLILVGTAPVAAAPAGLTLSRGSVNATLTLEVDATSGAFGDIVSLAPDLSVGVTDDLTLAVVHSTVARTGFRGVAGAGVCVTDGCAHTYDNVGAEGTYSLRRGAFAAAANGGVHAWSFDRDFYVVKVGARVRYVMGRVSLLTMPAVTVAMTERDAPATDRLWLPLVASVAIGGGVSAGLGGGFKTALDDVGATHEVALGVTASYAVSPKLSFGASWIHGKLVAGDDARPADISGLEQRAINVWVSTTH